MRAFSISVLFLTAFAAVAIGSTACSDNPAKGPDDTHVEAFGLVIYDSGAEIVRYQNGVVTGEIEVPEGEETPLLTVRFLDENGAVISTDDLGEAYSLQWEIADTDHAEVEHHDEDGRWSFHIVGMEEGETTMKIKLFHNDHADFTSKDIPVHVVPGVTVDGITVLLNGAQALTADRETASAPLALSAATSSEITVRFTDDTGGDIALDEHYHVELVLDDASHADIVPGATPGVFTVVPLKAGSTTLRIRLEHEDDHGHGEPHMLYESPAITVTFN